MRQLSFTKHHICRDVVYNVDTCVDTHVPLDVAKRRAGSQPISFAGSCNLKASLVAGQAMPRRRAAQAEWERRLDEKFPEQTEAGLDSGDGAISEVRLVAEALSSAPF